MSRESKRKLAFSAIKNKVTIPVNAKLKDTQKYIVADISGASGIFPIMDSNTKRKVGVCNFDGNKLNVGRHLAIDGIKIEMGSRALATDPLETSTFVGNTTIIGALSNSEFRVEQIGQVPVDFPVSALSQRADSTFGTRFREVTTAPVLVASEEIGMFIHFPAGVTAPANTVIRVTFNVHEIKGDK